MCKIRSPSIWQENIKNSTPNGSFYVWNAWTNHKKRFRWSPQSPYRLQLILRNDFPGIAFGISPSTISEIYLTNAKILVYSRETVLKRNAFCTFVIVWPHRTERTPTTDFLTIVPLRSSAARSVFPVFAPVVRSTAAHSRTSVRPDISKALRINNSKS